MQIPVEVSFRHLEHSPFIESAVRKRAKRLEKFYSKISSFRVMIELSGRSHPPGCLYHVHIEMMVSGSEIVVRRDPSRNHVREDIYVAIRDAFDEAKRRLMVYMKKGGQASTAVNAG